MSARSSARLRGKEQSDEAKEVASAPVAAASSRRATRKRDEGDEPQQAAEVATPSAASASASSVPDPKRSRRSSRGRSSASTASEQKKEEEEEEGQDEGTQDAAAKSEGQQGASDEEDADAAMADASDSPLDSLRVATFGRLFSAATLSGRPALPVLAVARVCDFLSTDDIVLRLAPTARASYATAVEYAQLIVNNAAASESDPSAASSSAAALSPVGHRSGMIVFTSVRTLNMLLSSRLRAVVAGLMDQCDSPVDVRVISRIAEAIPSLRELWCDVASATVQPAFEFPRGLRHLHVMLVFKGPSQSSRRKTRRFSKAPKSWTNKQRDTFAAWVMSKAASLPKLVLLEVSALAFPQTPANDPEPKLSWLEPLFTGHTREQLEDLSGPVVEELLPEILSEPNRFKRLQILPLAELQLTPALLQSLKNVPSLTDIWPDSFANVDNIAFVNEFPELRSIGIFEQGPPPPPELSDASDSDDDERGSYRPHTAGATAPTAQHVVETVESLSAARKAQFNSIGVSSDLWTNELVLRLLTALPGLTELELRSKAVTSLAALSSVASLCSTLRCLRLCTPSVPRDDVTHLLSLRKLEYLSIAGSFSEPLYAKQLFPFEKPYPKEPLHWLRAFFPRSPREPIPTPPVDPAAKAAADAEFAARVRSGQVSPAESLIPAQLSDVFEFLGVGTFSRAARTCRLWRMAASLPSAWTHSSKPGAGEDDSRASDEPLGSGLWSRTEYNPRNVIGPIDSAESAWGGRVLSILFGQPQIQPAVLPLLPIWRNVTAIVLTHTCEVCYTRQDQERCLAAIALLPRLETLSACFHDVEPKVVNSMLEKAGPHLRRLFVSGLPTNAYSNLSALVELKVSAQHHMFGPDLARLHQLRRLSVLNCCITHELAEVIRVLSREHALRELDIDAAGAYRADFFRTLAGEPSLRSSGATKAVGAEQKDAGPSAPVSSSGSGLPALLTRLHVSWTKCWDAKDPKPFSLTSVMLLPRLRDLELRLDAECIDLGEIATCVKAGVRPPPIEKLLISVPVFGSLDALELLDGLRDLRLKAVCGDADVPPRYASVTSQWNPRWGQKLLTLKQLEVLALVSVRVDPTDLAQLDQLPNLRALSLNRQSELRVADLSVLSRIQSLRELELEDDPLLLLQRREWMNQTVGSGTVAKTQDDAVTTMRDIEAQSGEAVVASSAVASGPLTNPAAQEQKDSTEQSTREAEGESSAVPYNDAEAMLPLLLQCHSLRLLRWRTAARQLQDSAGYTASRSGLKQSSHQPRSCSCCDEIQHCERKEAARERQALRTLLSVNPELKIEDSAQTPFGSTATRVLVLPPAIGSPAEAETKAAAEVARTLEADSLNEQIAASDPLLLAYEDRALLAIEADEEQEWREDDEHKAANAKSKRKKQRRKY